MATKRHKIHKKLAGVHTAALLPKLDRRGFDSRLPRWMHIVAPNSAQTEQSMLLDEKRGEKTTIRWPKGTPIGRPLTSRTKWPSGVGKATVQDIVEPTGPHKTRSWTEDRAAHFADCILRT